MIVDAEEVLLDITTAVPCGLILNEILTNSFKHGFRGRDKGEIRLSLITMGDLVALTVSDNGIGLPCHDEITAKSSLGMTLISGLSKQLGAELCIKGNGGTTYVLKFQKKAVGEILNPDQDTSLGVGKKESIGGVV